jgi:hypothetical protein
MIPGNHGYLSASSSSGYKYEVDTCDNIVLNQTSLNPLKAYFKPFSTSIVLAESSR